jgi:hypothetical protein
MNWSVLLSLEVVLWMVTERELAGAETYKEIKNQQNERRRMSTEQEL